MKRIELLDKYSGRSLILRVKDKDWEKGEYIGGWAFLTDYQRKRIESFFGKMAAYYTTINLL